MYKIVLTLQNLRKLVSSHSKFMIENLIPFTKEANNIITTLVYLQNACRKSDNILTFKKIWYLAIKVHNKLLRARNIRESKQKA